MIGAARWRKRRRESSASLYILVQIQAGPPAFAASQLRLGKPAPIGKSEASQPLPRRSSQSEGGKMPVDGASKGLSRLRNLV